jgi:hypothetical protein
MASASLSVAFTGVSVGLDGIGERRDRWWPRSGRRLPVPGRSAKSGEARGEVTARGADAVEQQQRLTIAGTVLCEGGHISRSVVSRSVVSRSVADAPNRPQS